MRVPGTTIGFEGGAIPMMLVGSPDVVSSGARTGTYAMRIDAGAEGGYVQFPAAVTELYARVAFKPSKGQQSSHGNIIGFANSEHENMIVLGLGNGGTQLRLWRIDGYSDITQLAVGSTLDIGTMYLLELHLGEPANEGGIVQVKLDGVMDIDYLGDTLGGYSPANYQFVNLGRLSGTGGNSGMVGTIYYSSEGLYDDLAVNDTTGDHNNSWVGRGGIYPMLVTAAGPVTGLTPSAGDNYECVDEVPPNDADYVSSDVVDATDLYELSDLTAEGNVDVVTAWPRAALAAAGEGNIASVIRLDGVDYVGDDSGLDTTYVYKPQQWEMNPATGEPWTIEELNAATTFAGPRVR